MVMSKHQRITAIRDLARSKDGKEIPYFKSIALDKSEHQAIRKEAVLVLGSFGEKSIEPLVDVLVMSDDKEIKKTATAIIHALNRKEFKTGWTKESIEQIQSAIFLCSVMIEGIM